MNEEQFLTKLVNIKNAYKWKVVNNQITAVPLNHRKESRYKKFNPVTAVARSTRVGQFASNHTPKAARSMGLTESLQSNVSHAVLGSVNRGYPQILRGRIMRVLGL